MNVIGLIDTWRNCQMVHSCRVCKIKLYSDYGIYRNSDNEERYYCFTHWKQYYIWTKENKSELTTYVEV